MWAHSLDRIQPDVLASSVPEIPLVADEIVRFVLIVVRHAEIVQQKVNHRFVRLEWIEIDHDQYVVRPVGVCLP